MKRLYSLLLAIITSLTAMAYDFQAGGIYYSILSKEEGSVSVTNGNSARYSGEVIIPEKVKYNDIEYSVVAIGPDAFNACSDMISVIIPNTITSIGRSAFEGCSGLTSISIPHSVISIGLSAFYGCSSLTSIDIPSSVTSIGLAAFYGCSSLVHVSLPNSIISIGTEMFSECSSLASIIIPSSIKSIRSRAFSGCSALTSIIIPNSVTSIDWSAFGRCKALIDLKIEDGELTLKLDNNGYSDGTYKGIFSDCPLETIYLGRILDYSCSPFKNQTGLTSLTIGNKVVSIGEEAFSGCTDLTSITIPNSVIEIGERAFSDCTVLTTLTIPNSVIRIGNKAFSDCFALTTLNIEDGETTLKLDTDVFSRCKFETLHLGRCLEYNNSPFQDNEELTTLSIGDKVILIKASEFDGCQALRDIISTAVIPPSIEANSFSSESYKYALVTVPRQSLDCYKEKWSQFHHLMKNGIEKSAEYHVDPAGALMNMISPDEAESITSLKLTGTLNGTDLLTINKLTNLKKLDINGCTIVSGGMPYYETDNERFGAKDNTLGQYWSRDLDLLAEIDLPTTLTTLDKEALLNKKYLTSLTIPSSVTTISYRALYGCDNISQLILQDSDTRLYLGEGFSNKNLEYLYLGRPIYTDSYTYTYKAPFGTSLKLKKVIVGRTVTKIESSQFSSCSNLTDLLLPNTLQSIGSYAFSGCSSLEQVAIPNPTESIGAGAFDGCSGLKEITLPGSMRSIGWSAFSRCSQLANVYVINPIPPVIESNTFDAATQTAATLHVPEDSKAINWVHPYWGQFKKIENWTVGTTSEFVAENVSYHITSEADATVEISSVALRGSRAGASEVKIPSTVRFNDKIYTVAGVANNGFAGAQMTEVELPATVNYVGLAAFKGCQALTKVTVLNTLPPSADVSSFDEATYANAKLSVVDEAADTYREHSVWGLFGLDSTPADPSEIDEISEDISAARPVVVPGGIDFEGVDGNAVVEIYSINGQRLYAGPARRKDLAAGYYIVRIGRHAFKVMVK